VTSLARVKKPWPYVNRWVHSEQFWYDIFTNFVSAALIAMTTYVAGVIFGFFDPPALINIVSGVAGVLAAIVVGTPWFMWISGLSRSERLDVSLAGMLLALGLGAAWLIGALAYHATKDLLTRIV
jgi:hypothetical protein